MDITFMWISLQMKRIPLFQVVRLPKTNKQTKTVFQFGLLV